MTRSKPKLVDCACDIYLAFKNGEVSGKDDLGERKNRDRARAHLNNKIYRGIEDEDYFKWLKEHPNCWKGWSGENRRERYDETLLALQLKQQKA